MSATIRLEAPAERVFAMLTNPKVHASIDGTGWVQGADDEAMLTKDGQIFRMKMYHADHPDGVYQTANKVIVFEEPHAIGWMTGTEGADGRLEFGGWFWRYDLSPASAEGTDVTLTYDWTAVPPTIRSYLHFPPFGSDHLDNSLRNLAQLLA